MHSVTKTVQCGFSTTRGNQACSQHFQKENSAILIRGDLTNGRRCPERSVLSQFVSESLGVSTATLYSMFRFPDSNTVHLQVKVTFSIYCQFSVICQDKDVYQNLKILVQYLIYQISAMQYLISDFFAV